jgi:uncharacterized membrane protein
MVYRPTGKLGDDEDWIMTLAHKHPANIALHDEKTFGQKASDLVAKALGSWIFLGLQTVFIIAWMLFATWDKFPWILLNLLFSIQAAYAAPLLQLSQNRQAEHDRHSAELDYQHNSEALEILRNLAKDKINDSA